MEENTYAPLTAEELNQDQLVLAYYTSPDTVVLAVKHPDLIGTGGSNAAYTMISGRDRHSLASFLTLSEEEVTQLTMRNIEAEPEAVAEQARWAAESKLPQPYVPEGVVLDGITYAEYYHTELEQVDAQRRLEQEPLLLKDQPESTPNVVGFGDSSADES